MCATNAGAKADLKLCPLHPTSGRELRSLSKLRKYSRTGLHPQFSQVFTEEEQVDEGSVLPTASDIFGSLGKCHPRQEKATVTNLSPGINKEQTVGTYAVMYPR